MKKLFISFLLIISSIYAFCMDNITYSEHLSADFNEIDIALTFENLFITETATDEFSVEISCNNKHIQPIVKLNNNKIHIYSIKRITHFGDKCSVYLSIPQNYKFEDVNIISTSGKITIDKINASNLSLKNTSGEIQVGNIYSDDETNIKTTSGKVNINKLYSEDLDVSTTSGDINFESISAPEAELESTSGKINVNYFDGESLDVESTSGEIIFNDTVCDFFDFNSTSGKITIELTASVLATSKIHSTSGSVSLYVPEDSEFDIIFSTNSGTLEDRISNNKFSPHGEYRNSICGGGPSILVKTTSGSFTLDN